MTFSNYNMKIALLFMNGSICLPTELQRPFKVHDPCYLYLLYSHFYEIQNRQVCREK